MTIDTMVNKEIKQDNSPEITKGYGRTKQAYEPELLQKEIECCTAATD